MSEIILMMVVYFWVMSVVLLEGVLAYLMVINKDLRKPIMGLCMAGATIPLLNIYLFRMFFLSPQEGA
jgi:hypothetical protein